MPTKKINDNGVIPIVGLLVILSLVIFVAATNVFDFKDLLFNSLYPKPRSHAAGVTTFTPNVIPISDPATANASSGEYIYDYATPVPPGWPVLDSYDVYSWSKLEPNKDQYDFRDIDSALARAKSRGGKFGFRIQAACSSCGGSKVPQYLMALMPQGFWFTYPGGKYMYAPDWNDPDFLSRAQALINSLSVRYNNDPRLGSYDISFYGDWAEWHVTHFPYGQSQIVATMITQVNAHALIDMQVKAFTNARLLMQHQTQMTDAPDTDGLLYALGLSPKIGFRNDCLGDPYGWFDYRMKQLYSSYPTVRDRWKTAPFVTEYCTQNPNTNAFRLAPDQIRTYHVATLNGEGYYNWSSFIDTEQNNFILAAKLAGYRIILDSLSFTSLIPGNNFTVNTTWSNVNFTPAYNNWNVIIQLRNPVTKAVVWEDKSKLDLQTLLPTNSNGADSPVSIEDIFTLPLTVAGGNYDAYVKIVDPINYYAPLGLAIQGRQSDGSYKIGTINVNSATPVPTETALPTSRPSSSITTSSTPSPTLEPTAVPTIVPTILPSIIPTQTPVSGSTITIFAAGTPSKNTYPTMNLQIDGRTVLTWYNVSGYANTPIYKTYTFNSPTKVSASSVRVNFTNDTCCKWGDINLRVDKINIDGVDYQSEDPSVYIYLGAWNSSSGCNSGYKRDEWLLCNGYFQYK